jgi:hypothetical protein
MTARIHIKLRQMRQYVRQISRHISQTGHLRRKYIPWPPGFSVKPRFAERKGCSMAGSGIRIL